MAEQRFLQLFHAFVAGFVLLAGVGLMFAVGGGRGHLPGRLTVAIVALLLLGWLDTQATFLAKRRLPLLATTSVEYRRFVVASVLGFFGAAAVLLGVAWYLP